MGHLRLVSDLVGGAAVDGSPPLDVNALDADATTPLMLASGAGHVEVTRFLLGHGADIHAVDSRRWNSILHAAYGGFGSIVELLDACGCDLLAEGVDGRTVLHVAVQGLGMEGEGNSAYGNLITTLTGMVPKEFLAEKDEKKFSARMYAKEYERSDEVCKLLSVEDGVGSTEKEERDRKNLAYVRGLISVVFQGKKRELELEEKVALQRQLKLEQERIERNVGGADEGNDPSNHTAPKGTKGSCTGLSTGSRRGSKKLSAKPVNIKS